MLLQIVWPVAERDLDWLAILASVGLVIQTGIGRQACAASGDAAQAYAPISLTQAADMA